MWGHVLDRAGVLDPAIRREYSAQRKAVRRFAPAEYATARLLLPAQLQPDVVVLVSFMHETDDRIDRGPLTTREAALRQWRHLVEEALVSGRSTLPVLQNLAHAVKRHPALWERITAFLDGAELEVAWEQFGSVKELEEYIAGYSLPALMLSMSLLSPAAEPASARFEDGCLALITAMQRLDFLEDLAEDAEEGRIGIPTTTLERYGLAVVDGRLLGPDAAAVAELVAAEADVAADALACAGQLLPLAARPVHPFLHALLRVQQVRLTAVREAGGTLATRPCGPSAIRCCTILLQELLRRPAPRPA